MTSLTLATLDNEAVENNTEQINKLFPKCRPRSDINLNPIIHHPQQHHQQQYERTTADNSPIHLINAERSSDRIIEIAGGREIYSQNRIKAARKSRGSTAVATVSIAATNGSNSDLSIINNIDIEQSHETSSIAKSAANSSKHYTHIYKSPTRHNGNVWELRAKEIVGANAAAASAPPQSQKVREPSSAGLTETVFSSVVVMTRDLDDNTELDGDKSVAVAQDKISCPGDGHSTGDGTVVVFDDIDENNGCWYNQRRYHDDNLVDVLMHNEQSDQQLQHQQRMYHHHHHHRPQNNGLDLRIDLADGDMTSIQSNQHIYQNDNILQDVQREENRAGAQKVIGNLPIAVYEGSPRRYGSYRHSTYNDTVIEQRDVSPIEGVSVNTCPPLGRNSSNSSSPGSSISSSAIPKRDRLDESHSGNTGNYGHGSNVVYMPRPGFPQRVIYSSTVNSGGIIRSSDSMRSSTQYADKQSQSNMTPGGHSRNSPTIEEPAILSTSANSTTVTSIPSTTFDYLYEFSETRKVLEEFFKCPGPPDINATTEDTNDHLDLDLNLDIDTDTLTVGQYTQCGGTNAIGNDRSDLDNDDGVGMDDYDLGTVGKLNFEFQELEYELRRQARSSGTAGMGLLYVSGAGDKDAAAADNSLCEVSGNAYVGQRLAKGRIETGDGAEFCEASPSPIKQVPHEQDVVEHENNFLDLSIGTGSSGDLGETEVGLQVGHSRNFTLSPETTDCDSNCGDLDSEVSLMLMDNELGPPSGFLGSSGDLVLPGDSLRLYSSMPVLEDGLSSGHASDTDNNNPTVRLMKKQITEIERELSGAQTQTTTTGAKAKHGHQHENGSMVGIRGSLTPKNESASPMNGCSSNSYESNHLSAMDSLEKTPPPPAPVPHRCDSGISSGEIDSVGHNPTNLMVLPTSLVASGNNSSGKSNCSSSSISANNGVGVGVSGNSTNNVVVLMDTNVSTISANSVAGGAGSNSNSVVEAAIKDIRLTLQRTKTLPLKCHNGVGLTVNGQSGEDVTMVEACSSPNGLAPGNRLVDTLGVSSTAAASSTVDCERDDTNTKDVRDGMNMTSPVWVPRQREISTVAITGESDHKVPSSEEGGDEEEADTDLETDRLLGQQRTDDQGFYDEKEWRNKPPAVTVAKCRTLLSAATSTAASTLQAIQQHYSSSGSAAAAGYLTSAQSLPPLTNHHHFHHHTLDDDDLDDDDLDDGDANDDDLDDDDLDDDKAMSLAATNTVVAAVAEGNADVTATIAGDSDRSSNKSDGPDQQGVAVTLTSSVGLNAAATATTTAKPKKDKESKKKSRNKEGNLDSTVLIEGVLFRARYLGSTQLVCEGQPTKTTRMMQAEEAVSRIKEGQHQQHLPYYHHQLVDNYDTPPPPPPPWSRPSVSLVCPNETHITTAGNDELVVLDGRQFWRQTSSDRDSDCEDSSSAQERAFEHHNRSISTSNVPLLGHSFGEHQPQSSAQSITNALPRECGRYLPLAAPLPPVNTATAAVVTGGAPLMNKSGTVFRLQFLGSVEVDEEAGRKRRKRLKKNMVEVAVTKIKAPDGETQPSTEVDLFISTEKIMVLNTDLKEIMMDHALRTISYIADIGDLVVLMARRRFVPHELEEAPKINRTPKMICHVFESEEAQFIAQSIGQAFQVAYMEFLKANGIEDHSFVKEMDYQEVLNSQEIFGDELQMFAKKEMQKEVVVPKAKGEILGVVIVESGWGSMLPTVVIANLAPAGAAARCGQLNIGDQIIAINGVSLVGLPLSTCQTYIKNSKNQTVVKLTVVPCAPVVEVKIKRPDTKYQLGFSVQNGVICSLLRGGIAERGGVRVGHRIIEINNQSVVAVPHEKIVNLLATSVGEILMKTMPTSMFRLLTGQENPVYI